MIRIKLDKFGEIYCYNYHITHTPPRHGGWIDVPPEIHLTLFFDKIPPILRKIAISGMLIEELKIYPKNSMPVIILGYVKIVKEETTSSCMLEKVYMEALVIKEHSEYNKIMYRECECGCVINFWYVVNKMSIKIGLSTKVISDIWNNDLFIFKCCRCFKKDTTANVIL